MVCVADEAMNSGSASAATSPIISATCFWSLSVPAEIGGDEKGEVTVQVVQRLGVLRS